MLPSPDELKTIVEQELPGVSVSVEASTLVLLPKDLTAVCRYFKDTERFRMDYASNITAVDYPQEQVMVMVYHLYSMAHKHGPITLKVKLPRANPVVASVTSIWRAGEFQEREVYDLYGVRFEGHPDLRRILMWEGFEGHPMRKDYVPEDQNVLEERQ
jgi:NADH/F420H2 dehydrogenase subunit C